MINFIICNLLGILKIRSQVLLKMYILNNCTKQQITHNLESQTQCLWQVATCTFFFGLAKKSTFEVKLTSACSSLLYGFLAFISCIQAVFTQSRAQTAFFLLCWGRERKGLVDLRMWFCVTANAQNLGVIYRVHVYCTGASIHEITPRFWAFAVTQNHIRRSTRPFLSLPQHKRKKAVWA